LQKTFYNVYIKNQPSAKGVPWYMLLGNHDYYGNATAQIAYAKHLPEWCEGDNWAP
jgi:hypothetical protein